MKGFLYSFYKVSSCVLMPGFGFVRFLLALCVLRQTLVVLLPNLIKSLSAALTYSEYKWLFKPKDFSEASSHLLYCNETFN